MKYEKSCGAIVENSLGQFLVIYHKKGHWGFPKGHVEGVESEVETACREVLEETGLSITIDSNIREVVSYVPYEGTIKEVVYFYGTVCSDDFSVCLQLDEVSDYLWGDRKRVMDVLTYQNDKSVFQNILNKLNKK